MMAKAVAHHTTASFIRVVGSEFVQKYLGEGPRMVRDVFRMARENAPAIIFIDEVDAIATKRFDAQTGADREVQRILLELLNQMDGFDQTVNVKVIMATNRHDTLDPALLRPGRLDRKIEFPNPDRRQKRLIFQVVTAKMNLSDEIDLEDYVQRPEKLSAADISAIAQEAGLHAVRNNRYVILNKDFEKAYKVSHLTAILPAQVRPSAAQAPHSLTLSRPCRSLAGVSCDRTTSNDPTRNSIFTTEKHRQADSTNFVPLGFGGSRQTHFPIFLLGVVVDDKTSSHSTSTLTRLDSNA